MEGEKGPVAHVLSVALTVRPCVWEKERERGREGKGREGERKAGGKRAHVACTPPTRSRKAFLSLCPECDDVDAGKGRDLEKKEKRDVNKHKRSPETQKKKKREDGGAKEERVLQGPGPT